VTVYLRAYVDIKGIGQRGKGASVSRLRYPGGGTLQVDPRSAPRSATATTSAPARCIRHCTVWSQRDCSLLSSEWSTAQPGVSIGLHHWASALCAKTGRRWKSWLVSCSVAGTGSRLRVSAAGRGEPCPDHHTDTGAQTSGCTTTA
jgi:hypothetical protein